MAKINALRRHVEASLGSCASLAAFGPIHECDHKIDVLVLGDLNDPLPESGHIVFP